MNRILLIAMSVALGTGFLSTASARQVGFQGAFSLISENTAFMNDFLAHYSAHHRFSFGLRHIRLNQGSEDIYAGLAQAAFLVNRWNKEDLQANLYVFGGAGGLEFNGQSGPAYLTGGQFDIEDRRFYGLFRFTSLHSGEIQDFYNYRGRLGIAPYVAGYDELNAWAMLQYDFRPDQAAEHRVTPFVRLFYKSMIVEIGSSTRGDWMINFITEI